LYWNFTRFHEGSRIEQIDLKGEFMDEQQSQKRGVRSEAQKEERARDGYAPIPPANPVAGAFGERKRTTPSDADVSLAANTTHSQRGEDENS
jgi:hypothetical protein